MFKNLLKTQFISRCSLHTSSIKFAMRGSPMFWGKAVDQYAPMENFESEIENLKKSMGNRYSSMPAKVEIRDYDLSRIILFETCDSQINIWSLDLLIKLRAAILKATADKTKKIFIISNKPNSFIHHDDYEFLAKLKEGELESYNLILNDFLNFLYWIDYPLDFCALVSGPCMDTGFNFLTRMHSFLVAENSDVCFGFRSFNKCNFLPAGFATFQASRSTHIYTVANMLLEGIPLNARQFGRFNKNAIFFDAKSLGSQKEIEREYQKILPMILKKDFYKKGLTYTQSEFSPYKSYPTRFYSSINLDYDFQKGRIAWFQNVLSLKFIFYYINFIYVLFTKYNFGLNQNLSILKLFNIYNIKLYNNQYKLKRAFEKETKFSHNYYHCSKSQELMNLYLKELKLAQNLPAFKIEIPKKLTIFASSLHLGVTEILYHNIAKDFGSDITTYTSEKHLNDYEFYVSNLSRDLVGEQKFISESTLQIFAPDYHESKRVEKHQNLHKFHSRSPQVISDEYILQFSDENDSKNSQVKEIEQKSLFNSIILTHTLSVPVKNICEDVKNTRNVLGFNMGALIKGLDYVELCVQDKPMESIKKALSALYFNQFRNVVFVKDSPGFFSPRVFLAGIDEYLIALNDGVPIKILDYMMKQKGFGFSFSNTCDHIGIDTLLNAIKNLGAVFPNYDTKLLEKMIDKNALGYKTKNGFFKYESDLPLYNFNNHVSSSYRSLNKQNYLLSLKTSEYVERILYRMINESLKCFNEGVVFSATEGDIAAIYGTGFPRILSGPFSYVDKIKPAKYISDLQKIYSKTQRDVFLPPDFIKELANTGNKLQDINY